MLKQEMMKTIFQIQNEEVLNEIFMITKEIEFPKHQMILGIKEKHEYIYVILKGIVRSFYLDIQGNDVTKMFMKEKDFCIGESLFEKQQSEQGFETLEPVRALRMNAAELKRIILANEELTQVYIQYLEENLLYKMKRENSFQIMSATERYLSFHKEHPEIERRVNQSYLASYLGIAPESLSRIKRMVKEER